MLIGQTKGIGTNNSLKPIPKTRSRRKMNLYYFLNLIYSPQFNKYKPLVYIAVTRREKLSGKAGGTELLSQLRPNPYNTIKKKMYKLEWVYKKASQFKL